jgi:hypothetical protein
MKKPHKYQRVGNVTMGLDEWGMPVGYIRDFEMVLRPPERVVETRK